MRLDYHLDLIALEHPVRAQDREALATRLPYQHPVEGIAMVGGRAAATSACRQVIGKERQPLRAATSNRSSGTSSFPSARLIPTSQTLAADR